ncbi:type II toxin-antitoxin system Phd/YefM family antitoxin [Streptococcus entericus]|uniref:type II toxin-antitoxin system Phd/YefM family antitoxin n=1 Tax=Streptococcus entericus TaxID=155680 RepID=UPI00037FC413|nr:type II toxin-antitoxin system prevent-host-death family antitoxin [Streptococcus entericus]
MEAVAYSTFRKDLRSYMRRVNEDVEPLIVTAKDVEDTVVVLSKRDYDSMQETLRVLSNNYLVEKLKRGEQQFRTAGFREHDLIEVEE